MNKQITKKEAQAITFNLPVSGSVSVCEQSQQEWERLKRFSDRGGWELLGKCYEQKRVWREWEKKHCH